MENPAPTPQQPAKDDGKTIAIVSYLTLIGWIIAYVMHGSNKTKIGAYHLRQSLGLGIIGVGLWILSLVFIFIPYLGFIMYWLINISFLGLLVFWILGLVAAANGEEKPVPVLGEMIQKLLAGIN